MPTDKITINVPRLREIKAILNECEENSKKIDVEDLPDDCCSMLKQQIDVGYNGLFEKEESKKGTVSPVAAAALVCDVVKLLTVIYAKRRLRNAG